MIFLSVPLCVLFFILGGQINKLFRPIGVTLSIIGMYAAFHNYSVWLFLPCLWYGFTLSLGYGENSKLMKWLKSEQWVRIWLGLSSSLPVMIIAGLTMNWWCFGTAPIVLVAVECIRMGKWFSVGKFDVLPVDIFRGLALGLAISWALL